MVRPARGEIWQIDLTPKKGTERKERRPCLVISSDALNGSELGSLIVLPVTSRDGAGFGWRVRLDPSDFMSRAPDWRPKPCWVLTDQIVTVNRASRALRRLATLREVGAIDDIEASLLGLLKLWERVM